MENSEKLDLILSKLASFETVLIGINGDGGVIAEQSAMRKKLHENTEAIIRIVGELKTAAQDHVNIKEDISEHTGKIKDLFILHNSSEIALTKVLTSLTIKIGIGGAIGTAIMVSIVGFIITKVLA